MDDLKTIDLSVLYKLVEEFKQKEADLTPNITFFEIAGFPSRENVFSNVLKFYLDSRQKHGLGCNVLKALLFNILPSVLDADLNTIEIKREVTTEKLNRIDLVIVTTKYVIGIENKVYHSLANDLNDYASYLKKKYSKELILLVLNLQNDSLVGDDKGFKYISYRTFLANLEAQVEDLNKNKYHVFWQEFVQNIKNHFPSNMTEEQIRFVANNADEIKKIKSLSEKASIYLSTRTADVLKKVKFSKENWYVYHEVAYSFEFHTQKGTPLFKIACTFEISKIYIEVACDNKDVFSKLHELIIKHYKIEIPVINNWLYVKEFKQIYAVENQEVEIEVEELILIIDEFILKSLTQY